MKNKYWGWIFIAGAVIGLLLDETLGFPAKTTHGVLFVLLGVYFLLLGKKK